MRLVAIFLSLVALLAVEMASAKSMWKPNFGPAPFPIEVSVLNAYGTGCPQGSIGAALSPDQRTVSILFDQLGTQMTAGSGVLQDRKTCTIALGIKIYGQNRVAIVGSDVRGFASVPSQASSSISVKHRSIFDPMGRYAQLMDFQKNVVGPADENVEMMNRFHQKPLWSHCGTQMRYNTQTAFMNITIDINSQNRNSASDLITMIDSFDFSAAPLSYQIAWTVDRKNCPK